MKKCPQCGREYDNTMMFCLDDGAELLYGPASMDEPKTAILHPTESPSEAATRAQIHMTDQTAVLPPGISDVPKKSFDKRLLLVPLTLAVIILGGLFGYRYITPAKQINSIAVMPFVNESGNADLEYLSDGITETMINSLSQLPNLKVMSRGSVFRFKGTWTDAKKIGAELSVGALLTGRVKQVGDQLIITVSLDDTQDNHHIWGEQYTRKQSDLLSLQREIARDVAGNLKSKLSGAEVAKVEKTYTANPEAYRLYLMGRFQWNKLTVESLKQAVEYYRQAVEKDPNYALAYSGLAQTYMDYPTIGVASSNDSMPQAKVAAQRALELDYSLAEPHVTLGVYLTSFEWDRVGGEKEVRRAIELNPKDATAHQLLGSVVLVATKRFDEAIAELKRADELDPLSPRIGTDLGSMFVCARRYDEAIAQYKRVLALDSDFAFAHLNLGWAYGFKGMYPEAIAETRKYLELSDDPTGKGYLGLWLARSGAPNDAMKLLNGLKQDSTSHYIPSYSFALIHIGLNEKEEALTWLEKEIFGHSPNANYYGVYPELDPLRSDPRFKERLNRLNLPE